MMVFLLLGMPASAASAEAAGRCYPPPCAVEGGAPADPSGPTPVVGARALSAERSAAPLVLVGLAAVMGSLTVVGLRRRTHILRRSPPVLAPRPSRPASGPAAPTPARSKQAALRSSVL